MKRNYSQLFNEKEINALKLILKLHMIYIYKLSDNLLSSLSDLVKAISLVYILNQLPSLHIPQSIKNYIYLERKFSKLWNEVQTKTKKNNNLLYNKKLIINII